MSNQQCDAQKLVFFDDQVHCPCGDNYSADTQNGEILLEHGLCENCLAEQDMLSEPA